MSGVSSPTSTTDEWKYFSLPNCQGTPYSFKGDSQCYPKFPFRVNSAARMSYDVSDACVFYFDNSCYTGNKIRICNDLPNLDSLNFRFNILNNGSFFFGKNIKIGLTFYSEVNYKGKKFVLQPTNQFNISGNTELLTAMANAKSVSVTK